MVKEKNRLILPIFIAVVSLLSIGAIAEMFSSAFSKIKSLSFSKSKIDQTELELAPQL